MKIMREKINAGYINSREKLWENLSRVFTENDHPEYRGLFKMHEFVKSKEEEQKSLKVMYDELYSKIDLEENFEQEYESWAEEEVFMFQGY